MKFKIVIIQRKKCDASLAKKGKKECIACVCARSTPTFFFSNKFHVFSFVRFTGSIDSNFHGAYIRRAIPFEFYKVKWSVTTKQNKTKCNISYTRCNSLAYVNALRQQWANNCWCNANQSWRFQILTIKKNYVRYQLINISKLIGVPRDGSRKKVELVNKLNDFSFNSSRYHLLVV